MTSSSLRSMRRDRSGISVSMKQVKKYHSSSEHNRCQENGYGGGGALEACERIGLDECKHETSEKVSFKFRKAIIFDAYIS